MFTDRDRDLDLVEGKITESVILKIINPSSVFRVTVLHPRQDAGGKNYHKKDFYPVLVKILSGLQL